MRTLLGVSIAAVVLAAATLPAKAGTEFRYQNAQGGIVCQLSIPTVDTAVRARATGFRNEGTASTFIICGMESANSQETLGTIKGLTIGLYSLNGVSATVSCTAVNGYAAGVPIYATKSVTTKADGSATLLSFDASDFGGTAGMPLPDSDYWSVTCNLPGKSSIGYMYSEFNVNVPNPPPA